MKYILTISLTLLIWNLKAQTIEFKLYHCESTSLVRIKKDSLHFENLLLKPVKEDTLISKNDLDSLNLLFQDILKKKGDEVWLNHCVDDGTNLKFIITRNGISKKVFVGNYFDHRLNKIALIINKYLKKVNAEFITTIPYGTTNESIIEKEVGSQNNCEEAPESYKKSMLNEWCEPYK
ncbi:hypothetical protein [Kordia zhangzhouensis]|uniref:hypothetical protein n=1 Tax=Kordia zhangzhouensis TaxID=1620405 RepID=UPI0006292EFD|nr:hypothetical protein [Kordia zhangzhouensis]